MTTDRTCRDGGTCHHRCTDTDCFRERTCAPLTGYVGPWGSEDWPRKTGCTWERSVVDAARGLRAAHQLNNWPAVIAAKETLVAIIQSDNFPDPD